MKYLPLIEFINSSKIILIHKKNFAWIVYKLKLTPPNPLQQTESPFENETCLLLEGEVTVTPEEGQSVKFGAGDLVIFPAGMNCRWDVHQAVCKHYRFGD